MINLTSDQVLNPIVFAEKVNRQYLRYRFSRLPLKDERLREQSEKLVGKPDRSIFIKGPYVTLSRPLRKGKTIEELCREGIFHHDLCDRSIAEFTSLFEHQERAARAIKNGKNLIISTSTGSGKTEAFLYPIISRCLELRDDGKLKGVVAVLIYPMNALANDQNERLRRILVGTGITFGTYTGATPETKNDAERVFHRLPPGLDRNSYLKALEKMEKESRIVIPYEERASVEEMRDSPPNILITNMKQLELILTRGEDIEIFVDNSLSFIVVDEAHTFTGLKGSEVAMLVRRLREFAGKKPTEIAHIGTSATIVDPEGNSEEAARKFGSRFFGIDPDSIQLIAEEYEERGAVEIEYYPQPIDDANEKFEPMVAALERDDRSIVIKELEKILNTRLEPKDDPALIYNTLRKVNIIHALDKILQDPLHLEDLAKKTWKELGRQEPSGKELEAAKSEILLWLALGAATEYEGERLFRPKLHYFVRGPEGAIIYFDKVDGEWMPILVESRREATKKIQEKEGDMARHIDTRILDVLYCKNCGQHYYGKRVSDLHIKKNKLNGGVQGKSSNEHYWVEDSKGTLVIFTDKLIGVEPQEIKHCDADDLKICTRCGLVQRTRGDVCQRPSCQSSNSLIKVWAIVYKSNDNYSPVRYCPACGSYSRVERPVLVEARAVQVADVHILAQEMIQAMPTSHKKLLVFADSRQDAAFQAAWMQDHARRYRIKQLFFNALRGQEPLTTGDLVAEAINILDKNRDLQAIICPDLIEKHEGNIEGREFIMDRKRYFHIHLLREICEGSGRPDTLENLGLIGVTYSGIDSTCPFIQEIAKEFDLDAEIVSDFTRCFLDRWRRSGFVYSAATLLYSTPWNSNRQEVRDGWLMPNDMYPRLLVLEKSDDTEDQRSKGIISSRGQTWSMQFAKKVFPQLKDVHGFLERLWNALIKGEYIVPGETSSFTGGRRGSTHPTTRGYQVNEEKFRISKQREFFVCERCWTISDKRTPDLICPSWNCNGKMVRDEPNEEIYDVSVLMNQNFTIIVPREHSAQVPHNIRQDIERQFKQGDGVNCIVATPTLELGIDIGDLDGILMRNVPPDPSNYWQRAGRAGRRQRMAVIYTYCRNTHHDLAYFENPTEMLGGRISPPKINLRNRHMVERHINATTISALLRIARISDVVISGEKITLSNEEREKIIEDIEKEIPRHINGIIYDSEKNQYRDKPPVLPQIRHLVCDRFRDVIMKAANDVFKAGYWPEEDKVVLRDLDDYVLAFPENLKSEFRKIFKNFEDARRLREKLLELKNKGRLCEEERKLLNHLDRYIEQLETRRDLETYTLNVLAARGFLPGYGFDEAGIVADFNSNIARIPSFKLSRLKSKAIKEFVPGNMLYANGAKFSVIRYGLPPDEGSKREAKSYCLDLQTDTVVHSEHVNLRPVVRPVEIKSLPISDCILKHESRITDDEEFIFRMPTHLVTAELGEGYRGIMAYSLGEFNLVHYYGMDMVFLNLGPNRIYQMIKSGESSYKLGFPICPDCGEVRSPLLQLRSNDPINEFFQRHHGYGHRNVDWYCLESTFDADYLSISPFTSYPEAVSTGWAIIIGAMDHIEMEPDDLELMVVQIGDDSFSMWIIDRHPGGSGLLDQIVQNWKKIMDSAIKVCEECPTQCESSCLSCLRIYENQKDHPSLSRKIASAVLGKLKKDPSLIGSKGETGIYVAPHGTPDTKSVRILVKKLEAAGLMDCAQMDVKIPVESLRFSVRPDIHWLTRSGRHVCVYVDGSIHNLPEIKMRDNMIRSTLRNRERWIVEVIRNESVTDDTIVRELINRISKALADENFVDKTESIAKKIEDRITSLNFPAPKRSFRTSVRMLGETKEIIIDFAWEIPGRIKCAILLVDQEGQVSRGFDQDDAKYVLEKSGWKVWLIDEETDLEKALGELQNYIRI